MIYILKNVDCGSNFCSKKKLLKLYKVVIYKRGINKFCTEEKKKK